MMPRVTHIRCTYVVAQVNVGFYDEDGNQVGEETFPQVEGRVAAARVFYPHPEQLASLIDVCLQQGWEKINASQPTPLSSLGPEADGGMRAGARAASGAPLES